MKKIVLFLCLIVSVALSAQVSKVDSSQIKQYNLKLEKFHASGASNGQVIKYNSSTGKWEPGTDSGGSPGGILNSIQANDGSGGLKADSTVRLGTFSLGSQSAQGLKLGKYLGVTSLSGKTTPALILAPKFKINGGVPNIIFESPSGDSESWPFAFGQFSDNNINRHPSIGDPNRPADTTFNNVVMWRFNPGNMFGTPSRSKVSMWHTMEPNWYNGGQKWAEYHMSADWGAGEVRIFTTELQNIKNTSTGPTNILNWRGDGFQFSTLKENKTYIAGGGSNAAISTLGVFAGSGISAQFYADSTNKQVLLRDYSSVTGDVFRIQNYDEISLGVGASTNTFTHNTTNGYSSLKGITSTTGGNLIETGQGFNISRSGGWPTGIKFTEGTEWASILFDGGTGALTTFIRGTGGYYFRWLMGSDEAMTLNSSRNVGINQASPNARLHVVGDCIITSSLWLNAAKTVGILSGTGSPEGAVTASVGSTFSRTDGGASTSFYVKESGTGNTGWIAK